MLHFWLKIFIKKNKNNGIECLAEANLSLKIDKNLLIKLNKQEVYLSGWEDYLKETTKRIR